MNTLDYILHKYHLTLAPRINLPLGRDHLATLLHDLNFTTGVEVGVERGLYSEVLCQANPQMKLYGVDPWESLQVCRHNSPQCRTENHSSQARCDKYYQETKHRLDPYPNYIIFKQYSVDAVQKFDDESLDFVYIDANHQYDFVIDDITMWSKKVRHGGIVAGHDYYNTSAKSSFQLHVKQAVNDYVDAHHISPLFIWTNDQWPSWMWVKNTNTLDYIINKYQVDSHQPSPIYIDITRPDLALLFKELGFTTGAEIGVLSGYYSETLCQANPNLKLYSIDAWQWYPTPNNFRRQKHLDLAYAEAKTRLAAYPNNVIIKKWSLDAAKDFKDESLDFVFIDADHEFQAVTNDIATWSKKIKPGGIVSGHDFGRSKYKDFGHVKDVVLAWTFAHRIQPWFVLESAQFANNRDSLKRRDNCWLWVKQ